jgi:hypothetical protein
MDVTLDSQAMGLVQDTLNRKWLPVKFRLDVNTSQDEY